MKNSTQKKDIKQPYLFEDFELQDKLDEDEKIKKRIKEIDDICKAFENDPNSWLNCKL
jgi:hypothetical protein